MKRKPFQKGPFSEPLNEKLHVMLSIKTIKNYKTKNLMELKSFIKLIFS